MKVEDGEVAIINTAISWPVTPAYTCPSTYIHLNSLFYRIYYKFVISNDVYLFMSFVVYYIYYN